MASGEKNEKSASLTEFFRAAREFGGVDVRVNNVEAHVYGSILTVTEVKYDLMGSVNVGRVLFDRQAAASDVLGRDAKE